MPKIVKNGLEYSGTPLEEVTAWPPTGDSIQIEQPLMGSTDISEVGDGTVTGAISELNKGLSTLFKTATQNVATNSSGSFVLTKPSDCTHIISILGHSQSGAYYVVQYNEISYGIFSYQPPHNPWNGTISVTFLYI